MGQQLKFASAFLPQKIYRSSFHPLYFFLKWSTVYINITQNGGVNVCQILLTSTDRSSEGSRSCCTAGGRFLHNPSAAGLPSSGIPAGPAGGRGSAGSSSSCRRQWVSRGPGTPQPDPEAAALVPLPPAEPWPRGWASGSPALLLGCTSTAETIPGGMRMLPGLPGAWARAGSHPDNVHGAVWAAVERKQTFNELQKIVRVTTAGL